MSAHPVDRESERAIPCAAGRHSHRGFTLIEMLLVIVILGISASLVVVNLGRGEDARLEEEARRLALLLQYAHDEALLGGRALAWTVDADGYVFSRSARGRTWTRIDADEVLAARRWSTGASAPQVRVAGAPMRVGEPLVFLPSGYNLPYEVRLAAAGWGITITGDPAGRVHLTRAAKDEAAPQ